MPVNHKGGIGKEFRVHHDRAGICKHRQIGKKHAKGDGKQKQRLKLLHNSQIEENTGNDDHNRGADHTNELVKARETAGKCVLGVGNERGYACAAQKVEKTL